MPGQLVLAGYPAPRSFSCWQLWTNVSCARAFRKCVCFPVDFSIRLGTHQAGAEQRRPIKMGTH